MLMSIPNMVNDIQKVSDDKQGNDIYTGKSTAKNKHSKPQGFLEGVM